MKTKSLLLFILLPFLSFSQYKNLVLEGAGVRGIAYVGALEVLDEQNLLKNIEKVGGTSAGAITALAVALGYTPAEIRDIIYNTKFQRFNDGIGGLIRMKKHYGWYKGRKFSNWIGEIIKKKTGNSEITFLQMKEQHFKELYVTATCLDEQKMIVFSWKNYPHMKVKDAMRITMSVPLYFKAVYIDSAGKIIDRPKDVSKLDLVMDGGITGNFPIQVFDSVIGNTRIANMNTLGIRIDIDSQIVYDRKMKGLAPEQIHNFRQYIIALYSYVIENLNRNYLVADDWKRTISVSCGDIGPKVKRLSKKQKDMLIENGRKGASEFLKSKN